MKTKHRPILTETQQALLDGVQVRLIQPEERERFDQIIVESHYLHSAAFVGEQLRYVAEYQGQWVALSAWSAAAYKLKLREEWIGWSDRQKQRRLPLVVNHSRLFIPKEFHIPNLASRVMRLNLERLSRDWEQAYHHAVLMAETFVDPERFRGTTYKASGWTLLGQTKGFQRSRTDFYEPHGKAKQLWVRELQPGARTILRGRNLPVACQACEQDRPPECVQSPEELAQMEIFFGDLPEWRKRARSIDFALSSLVAVTVCALLCKVCLGQRDLAAFARNLTRDQMKALRFPRDRRSRIHRYFPPSESTFARLLRHLDNQALQRALLRWLDHLLGQRHPAGDQVSVDGKELLNSQGLKVASAYSVTQGRWLGSAAVAEGSNEIPAVQAVLRCVDLNGSLVTADALNTQAETARIVVQEKGGDFLFNVKGNQPGVSKNVRQLHASLARAFSPQDKTATAQTSEINRGRTEERGLTAFEVSATRIRFPFAEQAGRLVRSIQIPGQPVKEPEVEFLMTSRSPAQMNAAQMLLGDRRYWGIENGLHLRLDVIAGEDRSRVRGKAALNLAVIRRAVVSVAVRWIRHCQDKRRATMSGFYDSMSAQNTKKALKLVTLCKPSWLDDS